MNEEPVTIIDRDVLKVLSVDTRMDILKELGEGARTPSDLSKRLSKSDATIVEHLEILKKSGLVKKIEQPGKKWVFYTLTDRGRGIISSKSRRLVIIISTALLAFVGGFLSLGKYVYTYYMPRFQTLVGSAEKTAEAPVAAGANITSVATHSYFYLYLAIVFLAAAVLGIVFYMAQKRKFKGEEL